MQPVKDHDGYALSGPVFVGEDVGGEGTPAAGKKSVTITIDPGVTVFGQSKLSFLAINRGSKLIAEGTKEHPILFTGAPDVGVDDAPGDWGGLVLNGRAPSNRAPAGEVDVVAEAGMGTYGGVDSHDNSGTLKYVRIQFGGGKVDDTNELNGISFNGVGDGTKVEYVQAHANGDDCFEFFGGSVNVKHMVCTDSGDDGLDWTDGWKGMVQFYLVRQIKDFSDNGIEADNQDTDNQAKPVSSPTISNLTLLGSADSSTSENGLLLRRGTQAHLYSAVVVDYAQSCVHVDGTISAGFVGSDKLTIQNSRVHCATTYMDTQAGGDGNTDGKSEAFFTGGADNKVLTKGGKNLFDGWVPKSDSDLLSGGATPDDDFFDKVDFIGAVGSDDWTAGWTATPSFKVPSAAK
jgi:hypothetical protein